MNFYPSPTNDMRKLADSSNLTNKNKVQVTPIWERSTIDPDSQLKNINNSEEVGLIGHEKSSIGKSKKLTLGTLQYAPTQTTN